MIGYFVASATAQKVQVHGHRDAAALLPENTLPAIKQSLADGVQMLSLEVQRTKDDQPVLLADVNLDRTTNGSGRVTRVSMKELQALDAGAWFGAEFAGTKVPKLSEALCNM